MTIKTIDQAYKEKDISKTIVLWMDGCFDMMHLGHANAIRQTKLLFPKVKLYIGVHTDEEIMRYKGPTVMKEQERYEAVRQCKWADECVEAVPYVTDLKMVEDFNVDYVVHGEDITYDQDGKCSYSAIMDAGKFLVIKRTQGVSTTDLVGRMLSVAAYFNDKQTEPLTPKSEITSRMYIENVVTPKTQKFYEIDQPKKFRWLPTARKITEFAMPIRKPKSGDKIVYVDGGFDCFHVAHGKFLQECKKLGDFLIVGLHEDEVLSFYKGKGHPIMNLHERCCSVLSCRYVDDVIIGTPFVVTADLIDAYNIDVVVHGSFFEKSPEVDPYEVAKKMGIYKTIPSPMPELTTSAIIRRIAINAKEFEARNRAKQEKESQQAEKFSGFEKIHENT